MKKTLCFRTGGCRWMVVALAVVGTALAGRLPAAPLGDTVKVRPAYVNNAESKYFPPVFNQDGGSCGSASRIGYMFTHEVNAFRGADASKPENIYPTHFTWLLTNSHSGKDGMAIANGVPRSTEYGGTTYSRLFGNQDCADADFGWMQGYDKWYRAMFNRISKNTFSPYGVDTEEGREYVKNWLWNHQGDSDFSVGGICGIGVASACRQAPIADDPEGHNAAAGVVGKKYVTRWGDGVDHALTIVGYDDRIVFDLDSNKVYGEKEKDERGAWIIVNSWGNGWANGGFIYCPYKYGFPVRQQEGGAWKPEFYHVRKNYRPLRTLKVKMAYSRRSELKLSAGVSADLNATEPETTVEMEHFKYAGDGRSGREKQGLEARTPMLGKWADGRLHDEPMEFGYDLTDLSAGFDTRRPLKYFFVIESSKEAIGTGKLYDCSVLDYEFDRQGIEIPFPVGRGVRIESHGKRTVVSVIVQGEPFFAPLNFRSDEPGKLVWERPQRTHYRLHSYIIYKDKAAVDTLPADVCTYRCDDAGATYAVAALYEGGRVDSALVRSALSPELTPGTDMNDTGHALQMHRGGLTVPRVLGRRSRHATIEYWLKPRSWHDWNQSAGPGWGNFLIHANTNGALSVGWDGDSRIDTRAGLIVPGRWYHLAFVVSRDTLTLYVNGEPVDTLRSASHSGLGNMPEFPFGGSEEGSIDGELAELRIWRKACSAREVRDLMHRSFEKMSIPAELAAYYKGQLIEKDGKKLWRDFAGTNHARIAAYGSYEETPKPPMLLRPDSAAVEICLPAGPYYAGQTVMLDSRCAPAVGTVSWDAPDAGAKGLAMRSPSLIFPRAGRYTIRLTGRTADGRTATDEKTICVERARLSAAFRPITAEATAGERISFQPLAPIPGYNYAWTLHGADVEQACTQSAAAAYPAAGDYRVKLRVTDVDGKHAKTKSYRLHVRNVVPQIQFDLSAHIVQKGTEITLTDRSRFAPTAWKWQIDSRRYALSAEGKTAAVRMDVPGVYDVTLTASNEVGSSTSVQKQTLVVCNADSKNGLNFGYPAAQVETRKPLWEGTTETMTVDWWMNAGSKGRRAGIGNGRGTWMIEADDRGHLFFHADSLQVRSGEGFVVSGQWHHYAVVFDKGTVRFLRDGECLHTGTLKDKKRAVTVVPAFAKVRLGGEQTPMNAVVDEFRVWRKALPDTVLHHYSNAPVDRINVAEQQDGLCLYYTFNQSGGDVRDATSAKNDGVRTGFGPDGDAWGLSAGVFCLNFDTPLTDLTSALLPGSASPFPTNGNSVNLKKPKRYMEYAEQALGWHAENFVTDDSVKTGVFVDVEKDSMLSVVTRQDGFANKIENHKLYRTVTLPAGKYELEVETQGFFAPGASRLVVARGKTLPAFEAVDDALASCPLAERRLSFVLSEETTVTLGMLFRMEGRNGVQIKRIALRQAVLAW